jgi:tyrosine-protein phosphatase SIW14
MLSISAKYQAVADRQDLFEDDGMKTVKDALGIILDTRNHPLLIHDDSGKSTCTLLCSLIRRIQGWSLTGIYAEGDMFAGPAGGSEGGGVGEQGREVSPSPSTRDQTGALMTVHCPL